jgi:hypothetical protein
MTSGRPTMNSFMEAWAGSASLGCESRHVGEAGIHFEFKGIGVIILVNRRGYQEVATESVN